MTISSGTSKRNRRLLFAALPLFLGGLVYVWLLYFYSNQDGEAYPVTFENQENEAATVPIQIQAKDVEQLGSLIGQDPLETPGPAVKVLRPPDGNYSNSVSIKLADSYEELAKLARKGDLSAARQLGVGLKNCKYYFGQLERRERELFASDGDSKLAEAEAFLNRSSVMQENCSGLTEKQLSESQHWLDLTARLGDPVAGNLYFVAGLGDLRHLATRPAELEQFRANAATHLERSVRSCFPEGIISAAANYQNGLVTAPDPIRAAAYELMSYWIMQSDQNLYPGFAQLAGDRVRRQLEQFSQGQIAQITDFARRSYNAYCR